MTEHEQQIIEQGAADWKFLDRAPCKETQFLNFENGVWWSFTDITKAAADAEFDCDYEFTIVISPDGSTRIIHLQDVGRQMLSEQEAEQAADDAHVRGLVERGIAGND